MHFLKVLKMKFDDFRAIWPSTKSLVVTSYVEFGHVKRAAFGFGMNFSFVCTGGPPGAQTLGYPRTLGRVSIEEKWRPGPARLERCG